jgi:branched-chain amino acid transport system substrate-binding protein
MGDGMRRGFSSIGEAALGIVTVGHYSFTLDTPRNRTFVKAYSAKYGEPPSRYSEFGYTAANVVGAVCEALKGEVEDVPRVAQEIMKVAPKIETPQGPLAPLTNITRESFICMY